VGSVRLRRLKRYFDGEWDYVSSSSNALASFKGRRVQAFGEPTVDWREQFARFGALALIAPQASEPNGRAEFPKFRLLFAGHRELGRQ